MCKGIEKYSEPDYTCLETAVLIDTGPVPDSNLLELVSKDAIPGSRYGIAHSNPTDIYIFFFKENSSSLSIKVSFSRLHFAIYLIVLLTSHGPQNRTYIKMLPCTLYSLSRPLHGCLRRD